MIKSMQARNSLLLGQIALELKLITPEKLRQCLDLQAGQVNPRPIGAILVEEGFLTPEALALAVQEQTRRLADTAPFAPARKADISFGRLLVLGGHATQEQVNEALRAQQDLAERGNRKRLGEILVESGRIPFETVLVILKQQGKVLMSCTFCGTHLNVIQSIAQGYPCRRCGMPLEAKAVSVSAEDTAYLLPPVDPRIGSRAPAPAPPAAATPAPRPSAGRAPAPAAWKHLVILAVVLGLLALAVVLFNRPD